MGNKLDRLFHRFQHYLEDRAGKPSLLNVFTSAGRETNRLIKEDQEHIRQLHERVDAEIVTAVTTHLLQHPAVPDIRPLLASGIPAEALPLGIFEALDVVSMMLEREFTHGGATKVDVPRNGGFLIPEGGVCSIRNEIRECMPQCTPQQADALWGWMRDFAATQKAPNFFPRLHVTGNADMLCVTANPVYDDIEWEDQWKNVYARWADDKAAAVPALQAGTKAPKRLPRPKNA